MAIIFPPWIQASNPVPAYLQALSQGAALAGEQNQSDRAALQFSAQAAAQERAAMAEAERANQFAQEMAFNREREARLARQAGLEMRATEMTLAQRAAQQARELAAQRKIEAGIQAGLNPAEAIRRAAYLLPINAIGQIAQMDAAQANRDAVSKAMMDRIRTANALRLQSKTGVQTEVDGQIDPSAIQTAATKSAEMNRPAAIRRADALVADLQKTRPELTPPQLQEAKARFIASGAKGLNPDATERKAITADDEAARGIADTLSKVDQFNAKFGANAFDKFTGPIEGRIQQFKNNYAGFKKEDEKLAREIASDFAVQIQAYRKTNFGTALTETEKRLFDQIVDRPETAAYLTTLQSFRQALGDSISRRLENYPYSTEIPQPIVERYSSRQRAVLGSGAKLPPGIPPANERVKDRVYETPRGKLKWTGTGWSQP